MFACLGFGGATEEAAGDGGGRGGEDVLLVARGAVALTEQVAAELRVRVVVRVRLVDELPRVASARRERLHVRLREVAVLAA